MRFTTEQLQQLADSLSRYGWAVGRDLTGQYYAQSDDYSVTLGETKGAAGSHMLAMLAASSVVSVTTATTEQETGQ
jgi:putative IMPACT (imprinted ancient) family translation regulator